MKQIRQWMAAMAVCGVVLLGATLVGAETKPVNLNTATLAELVTVKGIGNSKAKAIIDHREKNGPFKTVDDLKDVAGIGDKMLVNLRPQLTVGDTAAAPQSGAATKQ